MDSTTILAYVGTITGGLGVLFGAWNHKRVRSNCCGHVAVMSIDVESTTPPLTIRNPESIDVSEKSSKV